MLRPENAKALLATAARMKQWIDQGVNEFELKALSQQLTDVVKEESKNETVQQKAKA